MRVEKLKISGFGPFYGLEEINFKELSKEKIFLISGNTGSGKTTIFDAICFALFGKASGSQKTEEDFISKFKSRDTVSYVDLTFTVNGVVYNVNRQLKQLIFNPKTSTNKQKDASVVLTCDSFVLTKTREVNNKIIEILGVNESQFKQIVILPQGEFRKLLDSSSNDKEAIFRGIFNTQIYQTIQRNIKEEYDIVKQKIERIDFEIETVLNETEYELEGTTREKIKFYHLKLLEDKQIVENKRNMLDKSNKYYNAKTLEFEKQKSINERLGRFIALKKELKELEDQSVQYNNLKNKILLLKNYSGLNDICLKIERLSEEEKSINNLLGEIERNLFINKENLLKAKNEYETINNDDLIRLRNEITECESRKVNLSIYKELSQKITTLEEENSLLNKNLLEMNEIIQLKQDSFNNNDFKIKEKSDLDLHLLNLENEKKIVLLKVKNVEELQKNIVELSSETVILEGKENELYKVQSKILNDYIQNQAFFLSSQLKENEPCMVCGSVVHKNIVHHETGVTSEEFTNITNDFNEARKNLEVNKSLLLTKNNELLILNKELDKLCNGENSIDYVKILDAKITELMSEKDRISNLTNLNNKLLVEINDTKNFIEESNRKLIENKSNLNYTVQKINEINISKEDSIELIDDILIKKEEEYKLLESSNKTKVDKYRSLSNKNSELQNELKNVELKKGDVLDRIKILYEDKESLILEKHLNENELQLFKDEFSRVEEFENTLNSYIKSKDKVNISLNEYKDVEGQKEIDLFSLKEKLDELYLDLEHDTNSYNEVNSQFVLSENRYKLLLKKYEEYEKIEKEYSPKRNLYNLVSGNNVKKISFESFILASYFDELLIYANELFSNMTNKRYTLQRKEQLREKSRSFQGLELEVYDYYTSTTRAVSSLSGGESFKASLSLAIGLSTLVKDYSKKVQIDTIFIDEGFGSLDSESLESAINTLLSIAESEKVIGIISHVTELKNRIETKLEIISSTNGSKINERIY